MLGLVLVALNLRPVVAAFGPLLPQIQAELRVSAATVSLLTTLPLLCWGAVALLAPALVRWRSAEVVVLGCLALIGAGAALRAAPTLPWILAGTVLVGSGIALANVLLPGLLRRDFPNRLGLMTGVYTTAVVGGAVLASAAAVPLLAALGGSWRLALGLWGALALLAAAAWWPAVVGRPARRVVGAAPPVRIWTNPATWPVALYMGTQSLVFFTWLTWLPRLLTERGVPGTEAGWLLALGNLVQLPFTLLVPVLAARLPSPRPLLLALVACLMTGLLGLLALPSTPPLLWTVLLGIGSGSSFPLALYLIARRARSAAEVPALSAMAQGLGYLLAAGGPLLFGAAHDLSGGWSAPLLLLLALTGGVLASGWWATALPAPEARDPAPSPQRP